MSARSSIPKTDWYGDSKSTGNAVTRVVIAMMIAWPMIAHAAVQNTPAELVTLMAKARLDGTVTAWCRAEFRSGRRGAFAVAVTRAGGGRYVALGEDGRATELTPFSGKPDLSCYSRAEAEKLDRSIRQSETIHGQITPRWNTTVVCGFIDDTTAQCWQWSPTDRVFVRVGRWTT